MWEQVCNLVIRPPRCEYEIDHLGSPEFMLDGRTYRRTDVELVNPRGHTLQCSHFEPDPEWRSTVGEQLPCVVYLHGNCGSRLDALDAVRALLPCNITVFCFDFSGSGLSGGQYISLGMYEKDDVRTVVDHLRSTHSVSTIGLWGRSMGAATALLYAPTDPSIAGMVVDSPFTDLCTLMHEIVKNYKSWIPKFAISFAMKFLRKSIKSRAKFDLNDLKPIEAAKQSYVPVLFAHAVGDDFIKIHHSEQLFEVYDGDKNFIKFDGDHNSMRPEAFFTSVSIHFYNTLIRPMGLSKTIDESVVENAGHRVMASPEHRQHDSLPSSPSVVAPTMSLRTTLDGEEIPLDLPTDAMNRSGAASSASSASAPLPLDFASVAAALSAAAAAGGAGDGTAPPQRADGGVDALAGAVCDDADADGAAAGDVDVGRMLAMDLERFAAHPPPGVSAEAWEAQLLDAAIRMSIAESERTQVTGDS